MTNTYSWRIIKVKFRRLFLSKNKMIKLLIFLVSLTLKKEALKLFENCTQIVDRIKDRKYKRGDIIEMVYYYNDYCADLD
ncbi:MAG: hypothetical protein ACI902_002350 [Psychroserpens sp.]|jgi:hypothetical protein